MNTRPIRPTALANRKTEIPDRRFDTTELNIEQNEGYTVHRDYSAHYFKYGFAAKYTSGKKVLEIGSGSRVPMARVIQVNKGWVPELFVACDYGSITKPIGVKWFRYHDKVDATSQETRDFLLNEYGKFDLIVSLEVIEHMDVSDGTELLRTIRDLLADDGCALLSTPVFDGYQAANHIHEYEIDELRELIERCGLSIEDRFGTFMSIPDVKKAVKDHYPDERDQAIVLDLFSRVRDYYSNEVVSNWLAPAFPDQSRNNVWKLVKS